MSKHRRKKKSKYPKPPEGYKLIVCYADAERFCQLFLLPIDEFKGIVIGSTRDDCDLGRLSGHISLIYQYAPTLEHFKKIKHWLPRDKWLERLNK